MPVTSPSNSAPAVKETEEKQEQLGKESKTMNAQLTTPSNCTS